MHFRDGAGVMIRFLLGLIALFQFSIVFGQNSTLPPCPTKSNYWTDCSGVRDGRGSRYIGEFKNNVRQGQGTEYIEDGSSYVGSWKDGKRSGWGTHKLSNGELYVGEFSDGYRHGAGTLTFAPFYDRDKYVGEFRDDKASGPGTLTYKNGNKYLGEMSEGIPHGQGTLTFANGDTYAGWFTIGETNGQGTFTFANGKSYSGGNKDNKRELLGQLAAATSMPRSGNLILPRAEQNPMRLPPCPKDQEESWSDCFGSRKISDWLLTGGWKNGKLHGQGAFIWKGGGYRGGFKNGDQDGAGIKFGSNGELIRSGYFRENNLVISFRIEQDELTSLNVALEADQKRQQEAEKLRIALLQVSPSPAPSTIGKRVALVIGNSSYKTSPLDNPANDAKDVAAALRGSGFETQELLNATKLQMLEATRAFERKVVNSDVALIYYAGHGTEVKGNNYMIPVGANIEREYELAEQAYDAAQWLDMLEGAKGINAKRVNIVILDACRNNTLTRGWRSSNVGLARMDAPVGTFLAYSTAPGKVAADGNGKDRNSPFAKHLVNAIKQPNMPIEQVFKRVRSAVIDETKGDQIPWDSSSLVGDFFFTVKK